MPFHRRRRPQNLSSRAIGLPLHTRFVRRPEDPDLEVGAALSDIVFAEAGMRS